MFSVYGLPNTAAVFESYLSQNQLQERTPSELGWIFSVYLFVVYLFGLLVGPTFDKYEQELTGGEEYYQIVLTFSIMAGFGASLLNTPAFAAIGHWFDTRRGLAMGFAATGGSVGGIIFPFVLQASLPRFGFAWSMRLLALIFLALAVPAKSVHQDATSPEPKLCINMARRAPLPGHDARAGYLLPILLNAGSVVGRAAPGFVADRIGRFNTIVLTVGLCMVSVFAIWLPACGSWSALLAFAFVFGFASGGNVSLVPACIGQLCDSRDYGRFLSTAMISASFGTLTGIPLGGLLLNLRDPETGWTALILFSGASYIVSLACYIAARVLAVGWCPTAVF
ncbi:MFS monocarboxylate [Colletotrichum sojae]|uniref:MFS monocarboxylate n=1 Tax=Colletotrichum sojae TaxID=2175907 RepID=A0A8H6IYX5_9PEZI|nr:MFS monocarboxylate [Colletotrichum sojae]